MARERLDDECEGVSPRRNEARQSDRVGHAEGRSRPRVDRAHGSLDFRAPPGHGRAGVRGPHRPATARQLRAILDALQSALSDLGDLAERRSARSRRQRGETCQRPAWRTMRRRPRRVREAAEPRVVGGEGRLVAMMVPPRRCVRGRRARPSSPIRHGSVRGVRRGRSEGRVRIAAAIPVQPARGPDQTSGASPRLPSAPVALARRQAGRGSSSSACRPMSSSPWRRSAVPRAASTPHVAAAEWMEAQRLHGDSLSCGRWPRASLQGGSSDRLAVTRQPCASAGLPRRAFAARTRRRAHASHGARAPERSGGSTLALSALSARDRSSTVRAARRVPFVPLGSPSLTPAKGLAQPMATLLVSGPACLAEW